MRNASASIETKQIIIEQLSQRILAISSSATKVSISLQYILEWANLLNNWSKIDTIYHISMIDF